jgi:hypothetical protein
VARTLGNLALQRLAANGGPSSNANVRSPGGLPEGLSVGDPRDRHELEANRIADTFTRQSKRAAARGSPAARPSSTGIPFAYRPDFHGGAIDRVAGIGQPLSARLRAEFEPVYGRDLSNVRIHNGTKAAAATVAAHALAYTVGRHIVFGDSQFMPETTRGRYVIAHELAHVIQQQGYPGEPRGDLSPREFADTPHIARSLSPDLCAAPVGRGSDCGAPDGAINPSQKFKITVYADKDGTFLLTPMTQKVGHSWVRLEDSEGHYWTYGFWPQRGFRADNPRADVAGCVHHPDVIHRPTSSQTFEISAEQFLAAQAKATAICASHPPYNLFGLQCTQFVRQVLSAAGKGPAMGFGLIWDSPNALDSWIRTHSLVLGIGVTTATSAGNQEQGDVRLQLTHRLEFLALVGEKLRLEWMSRGEFGKRTASLTTGIGLEITPQRVFLPSAFLFGGGTAGYLGPGALGTPQAKPGAGLVGGAGLEFRVDELATVGVEYSVVKDLVNRDPELHRLMITAGIRFY